jgi:hypothetical protein
VIGSEETIERELLGGPREPALILVGRSSLRFGEDDQSRLRSLADHERRAMAASRTLSVPGR